MLFNSLQFLFFLPLVFFLYWGIKERKSQNLLIVVASYVFYGWWDWRFLLLIARLQLPEWDIYRSAPTARTAADGA